MSWFLCYKITFQKKKTLKQMTHKKMKQNSTILEQTQQQKDEICTEKRIAQKMKQMEQKVKKKK